MILAAVLLTAVLAAPPQDKVVSFGGGGGYGTAEGAEAACSRELRRGEKLIRIDDSCVYVRRWRVGERKCVPEYGPNADGYTEGKLMQLCKTTVLPDR